MKNIVKKNYCKKIVLMFYFHSFLMKQEKTIENYLKKTPCFHNGFSKTIPKHALNISIYFQYS